jgi:hypothetical protein
VQEEYFNYVVADFFHNLSNSLFTDHPNIRSYTVRDTASLNEQKKIKVKLPLSTPWRYREGLEAQFHSFLTSALDGGGWSPSRPGRFILGKEPPVPVE